MKIKRKTDKCSLKTVLFDCLKTANLQKCSIGIPYAVHTILPFQSNFLYQGFLSQSLMIHRTAGEGRGPFFIPLYHFQLLTLQFFQASHFYLLY